MGSIVCRLVGRSVCVCKNQNTKLNLNQLCVENNHVTSGKHFKLCNKYSKSQISQTTHASNFVCPRSNYNRSLCIGVSHACSLLWEIYSISSSANFNLVSLRVKNLNIDLVFNLNTFCTHRWCCLSHFCSRERIEGGAFHANEKVTLRTIIVTTKALKKNNLFSELKGFRLAIFSF